MSNIKQVIIVTSLLYNRAECDKCTTVYLYSCICLALKQLSWTLKNLKGCSKADFASFYDNAVVERDARLFLKEVWYVGPVAEVVDTSVCGKRKLWGAKKIIYRFLIQGWLSQKNLCSLFFSFSWRRLIEWHCQIACRDRQMDWGNQGNILS